MDVRTRTQANHGFDRITFTFFSYSRTTNRCAHAAEALKGGPGKEPQRL